MQTKVDLSELSKENIIEAIKIYDNNPSVCKGREAKIYNLIVNECI